MKGFRENLSRLIFVAVIFILRALHGNAQVPSDNKYLKVGAQMPDLPLGKMVNYAGKEHSIAGFRGRLLILDFWATWCSPCIGSFPKTDSLRNKFKGKIEILPVTADSYGKVSDLLNKVAADKKIEKIYSIVEDKSIRALFNFRTIPHYVWINQEGKIIAQTEQDELTEAKIKSVLEGKYALLKQKDKQVIRRDYDQQLFKMGSYLVNQVGHYIDEVPNSNIVFRSSLTTAIDGLGSSQNYLPHRFTAVNTSIPRFLGILLGKLAMKQPYEFTLFMANNRMVWEVSDSTLKVLGPGEYAKLSAEQWALIQKEHKYCYEIVTPGYVSEREMYERAYADMNGFFKAKYGLDSFIEKRRIKCLILEKTSELDVLSSNDKAKQGTVSENKYSFQIVNTRFDYFIQRFASYWLQLIPTPIVNETGVDPLTLVNMSLECNLADVAEINMQLAKYNLRFREDYRDIDMIVVKQITKAETKTASTHK